jgi:hypothetical protein
MLYDPKWKKPEVELDEVSLHLLRAADFMEQHGWCRNEYKNAKGNVCLWGAIALADGFVPTPVIGGHPAVTRMYKVIHTNCMINWNDSECKSKEEAVAKLREAAYLGK